MGKGSGASERGQGCGPGREAWEDQARCHIRGLPGTEDLLTLPCGPSKDMSTTSRDLIMSAKLWCVGRLFPCSQGTPLFQCMGTHIRVPRHGRPVMMEERQDQVGRPKSWEMGPFVNPRGSDPVAGVRLRTTRQQDSTSPTPRFLSRTSELAFQYGLAVQVQFTAEETEVPRGEVTCPAFYSGLRAQACPTPGRGCNQTWRSSVPQPVFPMRL